MGLHWKRGEEALLSSTLRKCRMIPTSVLQLELTKSQVGLVRLKCLSAVGGIYALRNVPGVYEIIQKR